MFSCSTEIACDMCDTSLHSHGKRMSDCMSKYWFRKFCRREGWRTVYGKYDICPGCIKHYGMKHIRVALRQQARDSDRLLP